MRLNEYESRQYVVIVKKGDESPQLAFFDLEEDWEEVNDDLFGLILFEGYVDIRDVEICENPDFESFIKHRFSKAIKLS